VRIAGFVRRSPHAPGDGRGAGGERRLQLHALGRGQHAQIDAVLLLQFGGCNGLVQCAAILIKAQDAARLLFVLDAGFGAQRLQLLTAVAMIAAIWAALTRVRAGRHSRMKARPQAHW